MSFVVDTNTCSAYVRGHPLVFNRFLQYSGQLFISVVTFGELTVWASRAKAPPKRAKEVQDLLSLVTILDVNVDRPQVRRGAGRAARSLDVDARSRCLAIACPSLP